MFLTTDNQAPQIERDVFVTSNAKAKKNKVKKSMNFKQVFWEYNFKKDSFSTQLNQTSMKLYFAT